jgi:hypothetical protein
MVGFYLQCFSEIDEFIALELLLAKEGYNTKNKSDKASHRSLQYGIS